MGVQGRGGEWVVSGPGGDSEWVSGDYGSLGDWVFFLWGALVEGRRRGGAGQMACAWG